MAEIWPYFHIRLNPAQTDLGYEAGFEHTLVVQPNCLSVAQFKFRQFTPLVFHKLNLKYLTTMCCIMLLIYCLWWSTWCSVLPHYCASLLFTYLCYIQLNNIQPGLRPDLQFQIQTYPAPVGFEKVRSGTALVLLSLLYISSLCELTVSASLWLWNM